MSSWPRPRPPKTTRRSRPTSSSPPRRACSSTSRPPGTPTTARRSRRLVAPDLLTEWERRLDDFDRRGWRNRVKPLGDPSVDYVGLIHRGTASDRVVVRIEAKVRDYVEDRAGNHLSRAGELRETVQLREFWTLRKRGSGWMLVSIEQGAEGAHALDDQIVATPTPTSRRCATSRW